MKKVFSIAGVVYKESIRNRVILAMVIISFILIFLSLFLDPLALGEAERIVKDAGLSSISFFSLLIVLFAGTRLIYQELEKKSIHILAVKPVSRDQLLIGKFLGLLFIIYTIVAATGAYLVIILLITKIKFNYTLLLSLLFIAQQFTLLSSATIFFSTFTSPVLSGIFTLMFYLIGYFIKDLQFFIDKSGSAVISTLLKGVMLIFPDFYYSDIKLLAIHNMTVSLNYIIFVIAYLTIYTVLFLYLSTIIFKKREFF